MDFGARLSAVLDEKRRREGDHAESQGSVERRAGLKQGHLSTLKNSKRKYPAIDTVAKLADALGCLVDYLVRGIGPMFPSDRLPADLPELQRALRMGKGEWLPRTLEYGAALATWWPSDRRLEQWTGHLHGYDKAWRAAAANAEAPPTVMAKSGTRAKKTRRKKEVG